jgi:hypothetical protein
MYGKHFESLYSGSMIGSGAAMYAVWGYVIAHRRNDLVELNPVLLAFILGESEEVVTGVVDRLCSPDPRSRCKLEEGRRLIKEGEYVYRVVNARHYDEVATEYERRERDKFRKREERKYDNPEPKKKPTAEKSRAGNGTQAYEPGVEPEFEDRAAADNGGSPILLMRDGLSGMYGRDILAPWGYEEERLLVAVCKRVGCEYELLELKNYQRRNGKFFPKSVESLLAGWTKTLDRARASEKDAAERPEKSLVDKELDRLEREVDKL